ncbi:hypothetical protein [Gramella sp. AN32]|uniref:Uncharacterized protein n=1 Tax=Christiangramia antarctica TaxID=2058158 RepID=A0ABW5X472_9FLAO|nr:hypothetical protein [Gramella sp. AN32]
MKSYMTHYWKGSFMPHDAGIIKWIAIQGNSISLFFFSSYGLLQYTLLVIFIIGIFKLFLNFRIQYTSFLYKITSIYILAILVQISLSAFQLYPFSDRLFLWIAPGIYLILGIGLMEINDWLCKIRPKAKNLIYIVPFSAIVLFFTYISNKSNDIITLNNYLNSKTEHILLTRKAKSSIKNWLLMTKYEKEDFQKLKNSEILKEFSWKPGSVIVGRQSEKFGHSDKKSPPEPVIMELIQSNNAKLIQRVNGYAIYKLK